MRETDFAPDRTDGGGKQGHRRAAAAEHAGAQVGPVATGRARAAPGMAAAGDAFPGATLQAVTR